MPVWVKLTLSIVGLGMLAVGNVYQADHNAAVMAYVAGAALSVGSYLVGLFQEKPTSPGGGT
jgi:hypothetical protein